MLLFGQPERFQVVRRLRSLTFAAGSAAALGLALAGSMTAPIARAAPLIQKVSVFQLPPEARTTHQLIRSGGPFPYSKDGLVFANRERSLPTQARGFYREYTVTTPASRDRGARRMVCGGYKTSQPEVCYYSGDHYSSFRQIVK